MKRSLIFTILLFYSIYLLYSLKKALFSFLATLWDSAFSWVYLYLFPLSITSFLFSAIYEASSENHFAFFHFFFFGMVSVNTSCLMLQTSTHTCSGTLPTKSNPLNLFIISTVFTISTVSFPHRHLI